ncbi:Flavin prenyltransferase-like protein [Pleurotus pulmonarius]
MSNVSFVAEKEREQGFTHVLFITTGSVASVKAPLIVQELLNYKKVKVTVVATKASLAFYSKSDVETAGVSVWVDDNEWSPGYKIVAPCSANTLAKIASGICDNLATSLLRALASTTPTYVFPAMNTLMYEHPLTSEHLRIVREVLRYNVVGPIGKALACGDIGIGAMTEWGDIVQTVVDRFQLQLNE